MLIAILYNKRIITGYAKPYFHLLAVLSGHPLEYKFIAADLKPAPPLSEFKLTVNKILQRSGNKVFVKFCEALNKHRATERLPVVIGTVELF